MTSFVFLWAEHFILATGQPIDREDAPLGLDGGGDVEGWGRQAHSAVHSRGLCVRGVSFSQKEPWVQRAPC